MKWRMARARRPRGRHVQQELFQHGGRRRGAGRRPKHGRAGSPHRKRPVVKPYHGLHVVIRVVPVVGSLRRRAMYKAVREATITAALRGRFRIVHAVARDARLRDRGRAEHQYGAGITQTAAVRAGVRRPVPPGGDHLAEAGAPRAELHLEQLEKHREDQDGLSSTWLVDPFSSGISFPDWRELEDKAVMWSIRETYDPLIVRRPQSWVLSAGWKRHGPISVRDVPGRDRGGRARRS